MCVGEAGGTEGSDVVGVPRIDWRCNDAHLNENKCSYVSSSLHSRKLF